METGKFKQLRLKSEEGHIVVRKGQPRVHQGSVRVNKELTGDQPGVTKELPRSKGHEIVNQGSARSHHEFVLQGHSQESC